MSAGHTAFPLTICGEDALHHLIISVGAHLCVRPYGIFRRSGLRKERSSYITAYKPSV
jgi:hypothetical protein